MSLDPLKSRSLPPTDPPTVTGDEHAVDEAGAVPQGTVTPERMHTVLRRLADGFYDRADVRMEIARRLVPDMR
jgi:hypothetical protein